LKQTGQHLFTSGIITIMHITPCSVRKANADEVSIKNSVILREPDLPNKPCCFCYLTDHG
jgi:hypothetical protein